jgi:hypothetical protein
MRERDMDAPILAPGFAATQHFGALGENSADKIRRHIPEVLEPDFEQVSTERFASPGTIRLGMRLMARVGKAMERKWETPATAERLTERLLATLVRMLTDPSFAGAMLGGLIAEGYEEEACRKAADYVAHSLAALLAMSYAHDREVSGANFAVNLTPAAEKFLREIGMMEDSPRDAGD